MSDEEVKAEEQKLVDLAKYIKDKGLPDLILNLQKNEGMPTDSTSLKEFFHQNGINLRYLGQVADLIKDKENFGQLKYMLEREVVLRSLKHIINQEVRECQSPEYLSQIVCHIFNCLFATKDFSKKLDNRAILMQVSSEIVVPKVSEENENKQP